MSPLGNPTLEDFLRCARKQFHFLVELGFQEQPLRRRRNLNQFQVRYRGTTTLVVVEGTNWGFGVNVSLGTRRQPLFRPEYTFPLWPIVKLRRSDLYDALTLGDQLTQLRAHAIALRECAKDVLSGDFGVRSEVIRLIADMADGQRSKLEEIRYRTAIEEANEAFRAKDYSKTAGILVQHKNRLTPAQRLKFEYAKRKLKPLT